MKKRILLGVLLLSSIASHGQSSPDDMIRNFFNVYDKNSSKAIDELYATNPWSIRIKDGIENVKKEINGFTVDYVGKYYGYELITKKQFSESFILYSYLVKYDRQPIRFIFKFYKPNDKWTLYSFKLDANLDVEIEEAAKLNYLNLNEGNGN